MMYILEQRLQAQSIPNDKSRKGFLLSPLVLTASKLGAGPTSALVASHAGYYQNDVQREVHGRALQAARGLLA
jgi:hypothetical protein